MVHSVHLAGMNGPPGVLNGPHHNYQDLGYLGQFYPRKTKAC